MYSIFIQKMNQLIAYILFSDLLPPAEGNDNDVHSFMSCHTCKVNDQSVSTVKWQIQMYLADTEWLLWIWIDVCSSESLHSFQKFIYWGVPSPFRSSTIGDDRVRCQTSIACRVHTCESRWFSFLFYRLIREWSRKKTQFTALYT